MALVLLATFDALVARNDELWRYAPRRDAGVLFAMEDLLDESTVDPIVVVLGNSRIRDGVAPRILERRLGLAAGAVRSLAITKGTAYDSLLIYRRNRERLSRGRVLVVGVEDWYVNAAIPPNDRDRRFRTLSERLHGFGIEDTADLAASWAWRAFAARYVLHAIVEDAGSGPRPLTFTEDGRINWRDRTSDVGREVVDVQRSVDEYYAGRVYDPSSLEYLHELIRLAREDGLEVVVLQSPWRAEYLERVERDHPGAFPQYERAIAAFIDRERTPALLLRAGTDIGIPERYFHDYGHLATAGTEMLTEALGEFLQRKVPEKLSPR